MRLTTNNVEETKAQAKVWMKAHPDQKIWFLKGDLGAGKTSFVKGIAEYLGYDPLLVKSPTFSLLEEHETWVHADLYRLESEDEFITEELNEYLKAGYTLFIEWPERLNSWNEKTHVEVHFTHLGGDQRGLELSLHP